MNKFGPPLTAKYVREILDYYPDTGRFRWCERKLRPDLARIDKGWNKRFAGKMVPERFHRHGHIQIGIHCQNYMAHRIAWLHYYGIEPSSDIDHINGLPYDNRIENLRLATKSENLCNAKTRVNNTSGRKGVSWSNQSEKWYAYITKHGKMRSLGYYKTFSEAVERREAAEKIYHGEFARKS